MGAEGMTLDEALAEIERLRQEKVEMLAAGDRLIPPTPVSRPPETKTMIRALEQTREGQLFSVAKQRDALRLTDAERATLEHYEMNNTHQRGDVLRGLLERMG